LTDPVHRLVLTLLGRERPGAELTRLALLADWERALSVAGRLGPFMAWRAHQRLKGAIPAHAVPLLDRVQKQAVMRHLQQRAVFQRILDALDDRQISYIILKGGALAHLVYPSPWLRAMSDLDLWIQPSDLSPARSTMVRLGFRCLSGDCLSVRTRGYGLLVEMHTVPLSLRVLDATRIAAIRARAVRSELYGRWALSPAPEDMLLHLCLHTGRNHQFAGGLQTLVDIDLLLEKSGYALDWERFDGENRDDRVGGWVQLALDATARLLATSIRPERLGEIRDRENYDRMVAIVQRQVWLPMVEGVVPGARFATNGTFMARIARLARRLTFHYLERKSVGPRTVLEAFTEAWARLRFDAFYRLPRIIRRWWSYEGDRRAAARNEFEYAGQRAELTSLMEGGRSA
jgi:hypothetical protein